MLYVQLDTNWPDHPKIIRAGYDGAGLHAIIMCLAKRAESDGWVDRIVLTGRYGASVELIDRLVDLDLLESDGDAVRPDGWLDRNPSQAAIAARRAAKAEAGRRGNHEKWNHPGEFDTCAKCNPQLQVVAGCDRTGSQADNLRSQSNRTPTKSESESEAAASDAIPTNDVPLAVTAEQRRQRIMEAARQVAEERAIGRNDIGPGWVHAAATGIASDHHQALHAHLVKHPGATVLELIEQVIDAKGRTPAKTGGVTVDDAGMMVPGSGRMTYFTADDLGPFPAPSTNGDSA